MPVAGSHSSFVGPGPAAPGGVRRVLGNMGRLLTGKAAAGVLSLAYLMIATRVLGVSDYGVLVLVNAYALLMGSVVAFSGFHGLVRYGAAAIEAGNPASVARLTRFMGLIELGFGAVAIVVAALLVPLLGPRIGWSAEATRLALPYSLAVLATVRATPQALLQLAGRFDLVGVHTIVSPIVRLAGSALVWALGGGLEGFLIVWLASAVAEGAAMWLLALGAWQQLTAHAPLIGPWRAAGGERDGFARFITVTNFDITLRELAPNLAPLTVGWMLGPAAAGLLALAQRAGNILAQPAQLLGQASYAVLAGLAAQGDLRQLRATVWRSAGVALAVALPVAAIAAVLSGKLLTILGGTTFGSGQALVLLVLLSRLPTLCSAPIGAALTALGRPQRSAFVAVFTNIALFPLLPLLLLWLGAEGAGWHMAGQAIAAFALLAIYFARDAR